MKICLIGGIYGKGGTATSYVRSTPETTLEVALRAAGHEVTTLSHYDDVSFGQFDVIHVHHLSYGAVRLASDASGRPFVFTPHDASHLNGVRQEHLRQIAMRYVFSRADAVVSLSRAEASFQRSAYPVDGAHLETIPNGVNSERFPLIRRNATGIGQPWKILFVGQLIALKGCDLLLDALAQIPHRFELLLAYQTDTLQRDLEAHATRLGIAGRVKFLGKQDAEHLAALYQSSDLLVLPSATEALPSVISEAMLSGLPFVATAVGGIPEQAAGFGHLLKTRTPESLARAIAHVLDRYEEYAKHSEAMSSHARSVFSIEAMVERHLHLYERLAARQFVRRGANHLLDAVVRTAVRYRGQGSSVKSRPVANPNAITEKS